MTWCAKAPLGSRQRRRSTAPRPGAPVWRRTADPTPTHRTPSRGPAAARATLTTGGPTPRRRGRGRVVSSSANHRQVQRLAAMSGEPKCAAHQRLCRRRAEQHDDIRLYRHHLREQPRPARHHLCTAGCLVDAALTALGEGELEMLHRIGDIQPVPVDSGRGERLVQQLARWTDERRAGPDPPDRRVVHRRASCTALGDPAPNTVWLASQVQVAALAALRGGRQVGQVVCARGRSPRRFVLPCPAVTHYRVDFVTCAKLNCHRSTM